MMPPLPIQREPSEEARPLFESVDETDMLQQMAAYDCSGSKGFALRPQPTSLEPGFNTGSFSPDGKPL